MSNMIKFSDVNPTVKSLSWFSKKEIQIEHLIVSSLYFENVKDSETQFKAFLEKQQQLLNNAEFHAIQVVLYKVLSVAIKIFSLNHFHLDYGIALDKASKNLRKKLVRILDNQILKKDTLTKIAALELDAKSPVSVRLGVVHLEIFHIELAKISLEEIRSKLTAAQSKKEILDELLGSNKVFIKSLEALDVEEAKQSALTHLQSRLEELDKDLATHKQLKEKIYQESLSEALPQNGEIVDPFENRTIRSPKLDHLMDQESQFDPKKPISIALVAVEYTGFIKEGGLAEALEGLTKGLKAYNPENSIRLIFPKFSLIPSTVQAQMVPLKTYQTERQEPYQAFSYSRDGIDYIFIDHPAFDLKERKSIYGPDHATQYTRFQLFSEFAADFLYKNKRPDVIHLHDWHVANVAVLLQKDHEDEWKKGETPPVVFTYHNNNRVSQGRPFCNGYTYRREDSKDYEGVLRVSNDNLFVKGLEVADIQTTVSEKFAEETADAILGEGVSFAVRKGLTEGKLFGVLNGSNPDRFNPEKDKVLKEWKDIDTNEPLDLSFSLEQQNILTQKTKAKEQLVKWIEKYGSSLKAETLQLDFSKPFVTYIGRFDSYQKGLDKFEEGIQATLDFGGQFICMGTGEDPDATKILDKLEEKYKKGVLFIRDFKDSEGRLVYQQGVGGRPGVGSLIRAASDFIFMPSRFEPCGLVQYEGWLFGSLAIGASTGGLADTIIDRELNPEDFNGYLFSREQHDGCRDTIKQALTFWNESELEEKEKIAEKVIGSARMASWITSPKGYSPVQKYLYCYYQANLRAKLRDVTARALEVPKNELRILPNTPVNPLVHAEETYLHNFYHAKESGISFDDLYDLYMKIPAYHRSQSPHPYGLGLSLRKYETLGSHFDEAETQFSIEAPSAQDVSVILYDSDGRQISKNQLIKDENGVWSKKIPAVAEGQFYLYQIDGKFKVDPYGYQVHVEKKERERLDVYSVVASNKFDWDDEAWMSTRKQHVNFQKPMSIYELHLSTWKKKDGVLPNYKEVAREIAAYCKEMGYSHIEVMGLLEHLCDDSWGYLPLSYLSSTTRYGTLQDAKEFVNILHKEGIGVILDWVPGQFGKDELGLKDLGYEPSGLSYLLSLRNLFFSFGGKQFDFSKIKIQEFLLSSAFYWLKEMHIDGIRVDGLKGIIQSENTEKSHQFLRNFNAAIHQHFPDVFLLAEDYSMNKMLVENIESGGLGFDLAWDVGWTHFVTNYFNRSYTVRSSFYDEMKTAIERMFYKKYVPYISHDELKKGFFIEDLRKMEEDTRFFTQKNILALLGTAPFHKLMMSGLEVGLDQGWDTFFGQKKGILDEQSSEKALMLQDFFKDLSKKISENFSTFSSRSEIEFLPDEKKLVHGIKKSCANGSFFVLHNFTDKRRDDFEVQIKNEEASFGKLSVVFSSDEEKYGGTGVSCVIDQEEKDDFVVFTIDIPANTTLILRSGK